MMEHDTNESAVAYLRWGTAPCPELAEDERARMARDAAVLGLDLRLVEEVGPPRVGYATVRDGLRSGRFGTLLLSRLNGVGRSKESLEELLMACRREGWRLVAVEDGFDTDAFEAEG